MQRLTPLVVRLLVAVAAVGRIGKGAGLEKIAADRGGIAGHRKLVFAKREIIGLANLFGVSFANACLFSDLVFGPANGLETQQGNSRRCQENNEYAPNKTQHMRRHRGGRCFAS